MVLNLPVIPEGWAAHHRPVANSTMTGICTLTGPAGGYDYETGELAPGETLVADVPCRVQELKREARADAAGQLVDTRQYLVTLPLDQVPNLTITDAGPVVTVTGYADGHDGDPHLLGRPLRVLNVQHGTLLWERDLTCVDDLTNS
ncbi:DUF6093 family protein [Citricoccus sp. NR2]|uniref:DUF6093 family protein n=1 Tax=Citricoccus sp. NR2 TaxID=3004095 RepID=UPI0022DDB26E|nr:DUF6093 family protein [Citricoccus sp. NR2]WBL18515.1 DUF6093 family protein [Citricoccus sp. NR2]